MNGDDDERRRAKRSRDAINARLRRAARRREREEAWRVTEATGARVVTLEPPSVLFVTHIRRTAAFLERLEHDETTPLGERCRIFVSAVPAFARALEVREIGERLEHLERMVLRRGVA